ncbi:apyrase [Nilaparvata lugens]|uniref:apyrase n=1 Tax=Nilaparvata lugens TaxID=108931 RepID=UPI00193EAFA5|nr:apyrase [Nilaparvata lugens]
MAYAASMIKLYLLPAVFLFFGSVHCDLNLQILHINDFHARFEPVDAQYSSRCRQGEESTCVGGVSRIYSLTKKIKDQFSNTLVLNAGDNYQGTLWYTLFKWNVTAEFLGKVPFDVNVVGNHDFDDTISGLIPFLKNVPFPSVVANIDMTDEPSLKPFIKKSKVLERSGRKIGVIGYVLQKFPEMSRTGKLKFSDEATAVAEEASRLKAEGVDIIIALSHAGIEKDIEVAKKVDLLDVIVGGHSHTFMYTGTPPSNDTPKYEYPFVVEQDSKRKVLVVQAGSYSRYLGFLNVTFDDLGEVKNYNGNPIYLDKNIPSDPEMDKKLKPWKVAVDLKGNQKLGMTKVDLNVREGVCYREECNMGNFVTDAMVHSVSIIGLAGSNWPTSTFNFNQFASIIVTDITYADVLTVMPFEGTIDGVLVKGKTLIKAIEHTFKAQNFLQWAGAYMELDPHAPEGQRVKALKLTCTECSVPELISVDMNKYYNVLMPSFIYHGGDGFVMFAEEGVNHTVGGIDNEAFIEFIRRNAPITYGIEERINLIQPMKHSQRVSELPK